MTKSLNHSNLLHIAVAEAAHGNNMHEMTLIRGKLLHLSPSKTLDPQLPLKLSLFCMNKGILLQGLRIHNTHSLSFHLLMHPSGESRMKYRTTLGDVESFVYRVFIFLVYSLIASSSCWHPHSVYLLVNWL